MYVILSRFKHDVGMYHYLCVQKFVYLSSDQTNSQQVNKENYIELSIIK